MKEAAIAAVSPNVRIRENLELLLGVARSLLCGREVLWLTGDPPPAGARALSPAEDADSDTASHMF